MKKILLVVDCFNGGAGNMAQILFINFSAKYDVDLLIMDHRNSKPKYSIPEDKIIYFNSEKAKAFKYIWKSTRFIKKLIKEKKYNTVISFLDNINTVVSFALFWNKKINLIVSERSNPLVIPPSNKLWSILRKIAYKRANYVSVQFDEFKYFENSKFINKCVETPNIILPAPYKREEQDIVTFISCARFAKIKRFDLLIKMFHKIHEKNCNTKLVICGDGPERQNIEQLIEELQLKDCVQLVGNVKKTYEYLKNSDIYLMTSLQEGFPNALSEGLATGLSAVVFKCHNGIKKLVIDDYNGYCINEGDEEEFINKCVYLSQNKALLNAYGNNSIEVAERYSPDKVLSIWESLL